MSGSTARAALAGRHMIAFACRHLLLMRVAAALAPRIGRVRSVRHAAAAAQDGPDVGISFTVGGLLFPYQLGAAKALYEAGVASPATPLAGASSGAIVAVVAALSETGSPSLDESLDAALRVNAYCRDRGGMRGQYYDALSLEADRLLDGTSATRLSERPSPVSVAITQFKPLPTPLLASSFADQDDVKRALLATSCIPFYFKGLRPYVTFRGAPAVDGFFAVERRCFGAPDTNARRTIRVCPFPAASIGLEADDVIAPSDASLGSLLQCALGAPPAGDGYLEGLFARGAADAEKYIDKL